jgi:hypothetical protein
VGAVTGTTSWSVPIVLSPGTVTPDLLNGAGAFSASGNWALAIEWTIADGVCTSAGGQLSSYLGCPISGLDVGDTYTITYTVSGTPSGDLYLSRWGFSGDETTSQLLDSTTGTHSVDVVCTHADRNLIFASNPWVGVLDNITVVKSGGTGPVYNIITVTATDSSDNTGTDSISIGFVPPTSTPKRVMNLTGSARINIGGGSVILLEF